MALFSGFSDFLKKSVGNNMENKPEDVRTAKRNLSGLRLMDEDDAAENDILTRKMDDSLKGFQRAEGLKVDGVMKPGGETERKMFERLAKRDPAPVFALKSRAESRAVEGDDDAANDGGTVGFGGNVSGVLEPKKPRAQTDRLTGESGSARLLGGAIEALLQRKDPVLTPPKPEKKPIQLDATVRMIRPEESVARTASPVNTEALIEQIKARQDANTKSLAETGRIAERTSVLTEKKTPPKPRKKPDSALESKPVEFDATGRMMRPDAAPAPAPTPLPERKPAVLQNANDEMATGFIREREGLVEHLYKDNKGFMTVGVGHRVTSLEEAKNLPLYVHDKDDNPVRLATDEEVDEVFNQVRSIAHGQGVAAERFSPEANKNMKNIRLRKKDVNPLLKRDLRIRAQELRRNWPGFDDMPEELQIGMLDVHFNVGNLTPGNWPKLHEAIKAKDKAGIILEIQRDTEDKERNKKVKDLLKKMDIRKLR